MHSVLLSAVAVAASSLGGMTSQGESVTLNVQGKKVSYDLWWVADCPAVQDSFKLQTVGTFRPSANGRFTAGGTYKGPQVGGKYDTKITGKLKGRMEGASAATGTWTGKVTLLSGGKKVATCTTTTASFATS